MNLHWQVDDDGVDRLQSFLGSFGGNYPQLDVGGLGRTAIKKVERTYVELLQRHAESSRLGNPAEDSIGWESFLESGTTFAHAWVTGTPHARSYFRLLCDLAVDALLGASDNNSPGEWQLVLLSIDKTKLLKGEFARAVDIADEVSAVVCDRPFESTRKAIEVALSWRDRPFVPSDVQREILAALDGAALTKDARAAEVYGGDGSRLYKGNDFRELRDRGLVDNKRGVGFYRPDAPPCT